jgi:hypothetical protein
MREQEYILFSSASGPQVLNQKQLQTNHSKLRTTWTLVHYVANPSEGAQMPGCHVLAELPSARSGTLHPHFAVENRDQISRSYITLKLFFKSQAPFVMKKLHKD